MQLNVNDVAELLVALERITEELRCHNNDNRGCEMINESLRIQNIFRDKYHIQSPSIRELIIH